MGNVVGTSRPLGRAAAVAGLAGALALTIAGCSGNTPSADKCQTVAAPLSDVPSRTDQEPRMRIPVPPGWERNTATDSEQIRFAIRNPSLAGDGFTPNAVVTLQRLDANVGKPELILEAQNEQLTKKLKLTDLSSTPADVCGAPALSTTYTAPELDLRKKSPRIPRIPPRRASQLGAVYKTGEVTWVATVTVQTVVPDNQTYLKDAAEILKGFQLLPPK